MDGPLFHTDVRFGSQFTTSLIDHGCSCYATVNPATVQRHKLPTFSISPRPIDSFLDNEPRTITQVAYGPMDIGGHQQDRVFAYVVPGQTDNLILGKRWMEDQDVVLSARKGYLTIKSTGIRIRNDNLRNDAKVTYAQVCSSVFVGLARRARKQPDSGTKVFAASLKNIDCSDVIGQDCFGLELGWSDQVSGWIEACNGLDLSLLELLELRRLYPFRKQVSHFR